MLVQCPCPCSSITQVRHLIGSGAPPGHQPLPARVFPLPERQAPLPQKILIIQAQFFQAGAGHIGQFQLGLFRSAGGLAPFGDVLHPAPRRLHHLVVGAAERFSM